MRVLVVEDEDVLADAIARGLRWEGMAVDVVLDGDAALEKAAINAYDVIVLDRDLPIIGGDEVCRRLAGSSVRILMLTAARSVTDRIAGLSLGADDYLPKPFAFGELVARVRALGRRSGISIPPLLAAADVVVDTTRRLAFRNGQRVPLARKELAVLEILLAANGGVVSAEELLERAWDDQTDPFTNVVRMTMMKLRRKLGHPSIIETVVGEGYRIP
ncbi:MAG: response regulator transcription factor [Actinobacteria bacterium]|nr:MAG: response regulator transcription factor [Actinomycetota bacterium]